MMTHATRVLICLGVSAGAIGISALADWLDASPGFRPVADILCEASAFEAGVGAIASSELPAGSEVQVDVAVDADSPSWRIVAGPLAFALVRSEALQSRAADPNW